MNYHAVFGLVVVGSIVGCAGGDLPTPDVTPTTFNVPGAPTVEFSVPDMSCPEGCGVKTKEILAKQPGAKEVVVDFDSKTATVAIEEGKFDTEAAIAALVDHGFDHSTLKGKDSPKTEAVDSTAVE
jgi:copper chaperone CopZ